MTWHCYRCGLGLESNMFGREGSCPGCGADTRCCRNCAFDDPACGTQCQEVQAEAIHEREDANFCDFFRPRKGLWTPDKNARPAGRSVRSAFDALFRKPVGDGKNQSCD
ncbi:MAG: hypothetical protein WC881_02555 [Elusimicrobiota bacterium]